MKMRVLQVFAVLAAVLCCGGCVSGPSRTAAKSGPQVKYVFLFIGDGMGIAQRTLAGEYLKRVEQRGLVMDSFPHHALTSTSSANSFITDSAASGTALACGVKTDNGTLGLDPEGSRLESVAAKAAESGRKVGIVTSVTQNHATPAAFYAHRKSRNNYYEIALEILDSGVDYFGGGGCGGAGWSDNTKSPEYRGNIYALLAENGYNVLIGRDKFAAALPGDGRFFVCESKDAMAYAIDRTPENLALADFVAKGISLLDNPNGFFMMVEGGKIDWACHSNDAATAVKEVIDFDAAVKAAYDFALSRPGEVLIVVTADHETGGLGLGCSAVRYNSYIERLTFQKASQERFQACLKSVKKSGDATLFDDLKPLLTECFGFDFGSDEANPMHIGKSEEAALRQSAAASFRKWTPEKPAVGYELVQAALRIMSDKAGVGWTTSAHSASPILTSAFGPTSERFSGRIDNTDVAKNLMDSVK